MLLYIYTCLVFSSIANFAQVKSLEPSNIKPTNEGPKVADAVFVDVIKNISRVNHVLQELINNYEQLQKIYKSQENVDSIYSDSEVDEVFKSKQVKKHEKRTKESATTKKQISQKFAATQMYWSDHEEDIENISEDDIEDERENIKELPKNKNIEPTTQATLKPVSSEESSDDSNDKSGMSFEKVKHKEPVQKKPNKIKLPKPNKPKPQAEVVFIDTHKKRKENPPKPKYIKKLEHDSAVQFAVPNKPKTRYSKVSHNKDTNSEAQTQNVLSNGKSNDSKVKKIMYAESFSAKKIWNDIIKNKPIQLEAHNDITLRRVETVKKTNSTALNKRSKKGGKTAVVVITNNKKENEETILSEDDETTLKDQLQTNVLRQAYGDACLKLVLRKCYKACKKVSKASCNRVKCRSDAKSAFLTASRNGCLKEFHSEKPTMTTSSHVNPTFTNFRGQTDFFVDMTRTGYLSAACLPHVGVTKTTLRNATPTNLEQNFNILRDRFERACQRLSSDKCQNACHNATTEMCHSHTCSKRLTKTFKRNCKEKCRNAYGLKKKDSDSESETDTDTETESSTDTD